MQEAPSTSDEIKRLRAKVAALEHRVPAAEAAARAAAISPEVALRLAADPWRKPAA
jgi:hypothetical protein